MWHTTWVWGVVYQEITFRTESVRGWARAASPKNWDPYILHDNNTFISATIEGSNFKFNIQPGFVEYVTTTALVPNLIGTGWATGACQKLCGPGNMYPVPINSYRKLCNKTANITVNNNLAIANRSRVSCTYNTSRASMITP